MNVWFFTDSVFLTHTLAYLAGLFTFPVYAYGAMHLLEWYERRRLGLDEPSPEDDL